MIKFKLLSKRSQLFILIIFTAIIGEVIALSGAWLGVDLALLTVVVIVVVLVALYSELAKYRFMRRKVR